MAEFPKLVKQRIHLLAKFGVCNVYVGVLSACRRLTEYKLVSVNNSKWGSIAIGWIRFRVSFADAGLSLNRSGDERIFRLQGIEDFTQFRTQSLEKVRVCDFLILSLHTVLRRMDFVK